MRIGSSGLRGVPMAPPRLPSSLPQDWAVNLDTIAARLQEGIAAAQSRAESATAFVETQAGARRDELNQSAARVHAFDDRANQALAIADEADRSIVAAQGAVQRYRADAQSLRLRLAAWAARAIG